MRKGENALTRYEWKKASVQYYFLLGWMGQFHYIFGVTKAATFPSNILWTARTQSNIKWTWINGSHAIYFPHQYLRKLNIIQCTGIKMHHDKSNQKTMQYNEVPNIALP